MRVDAKKAEGLRNASSLDSFVIGTQMCIKGSFLSVTYSHSKQVVLKTVTPSKLSEMKSLVSTV